MKEKILDLIRKEQGPLRPSIHLHKGKDLTYKGSKIGGTPFLTCESDLVKKNGEYLKLLAQVNLGDLDKLEGFPVGGILQVWIGDLNRSNFENFEVKYFSPDQVEGGLTEEEAESVYLNPDDTTGMYPMYGAFALEGDYREECMAGRAFDNLDDEVLDDEELFEYFLEDLKGTKLGGYPFTYRGSGPLLKDSSLVLIQMDSMEGDTGSLIWGNFGIANITMEKEDLEKLDFSKAKLYWDQSPDFMEDYGDDFGPFDGFSF